MSFRCPFPTVAIPAGNVSSIYDPKGVINEMIDHIREVLSKNQIFVGVIVGNYGFGKTHILLYIREKINLTTNSFAVYIPSPGMSIKTFYSYIAREIIKLVKENRSIIEYLNEPIASVIEVIARSGEDEQSYYFKQWFIGESVPIKYRQKYGLGGNINEERALEIMTMLLNSIHQAGISPIVILVDEIENLIMCTNVKRLRYLNYLRILIDSLPVKTVFIVASTPAGWNEIINTHPALARRLSSYILYLKPFNEDDVKGLLEFYMNKSNTRIEWLLRNEVIDLIYEYSDGNPGEVLKLASILCIYANAKGLKELDIELVKEVLSQYV